jgi:hydrogenase-1 operon protein HyaF
LVKVGQHRSDTGGIMRDLVATFADQIGEDVAAGKKELQNIGVGGQFARPNFVQRGLETMGEGEVSIKVQGKPALKIQESWFAGVWLVAGHGVDRIDVGQVPPVALERAHLPHRAGEGSSIKAHDGLANGPAILTELMDKTASWQRGDAPHVVNLTLLPHTESDLVWLDRAFGEGSVTILSRGYGNCRITALALRHLWRVQFYNSTDQLILDTFEVTHVPEVALAADVDLSDSAERISEVIGAIS